jgi:hypothetical protein
MFNPNGGVDVKDMKNAIDYKAVFTGVVDATPLCFNPTKEDLIRVKEIPEDRQDKVRDPNPYVASYTDNNGVEHTRLELLCRINPNEILNEKNEAGELVERYTNEHYFSVSFLIADLAEQSSKGNYRFINESLQHTWAPSLDAIKENPKMDWFDTGTARKAKVGEVQLYELLYAWYKKAGSKDAPIKGFKLGEDASDTFAEIVSGDVSMLNDMLDSSSESFQYFSHDDGSVRKIAMLLGVQSTERVDNDGRPYYNQRVFTYKHVSPFAKEGRSLQKDATQAVLDGKFKANNQGSFDFKVYDPLSAAEAAAQMDQASTEVLSEIPMTDGMEGDFNLLDDPNLLD